MECCSKEDTAGCWGSSAQACVVLDPLGFARTCHCLGCLSDDIGGAGSRCSKHSLVRPVHPIEETLNGPDSESVTKFFGSLRNSSPWNDDNGVLISHHFALGNLREERRRDVGTDPATPQSRNNTS